MKRILFLFVALIMNVAVFAQPRNGQHRFERIHAIKVGFITDRVKLTPEQAEKFWPVYNQFEDEMRTIRREFMAKNNKGNEHVTDEQSLQMIEDNLDYQQQMLDLKKKYKDQFLKVITPQQLAKLMDTEREFKQMLLKRLQERRGGGRED